MSQTETHVLLLPTPPSLLQASMIARGAAAALPKARELLIRWFGPLTRAIMEEQKRVSGGPENRLTSAARTLPCCHERRAAGATGGGVGAVVWKGPACGEPGQGALALRGSGGAEAGEARCCCCCCWRRCCCRPAAAALLLAPLVLVPPPLLPLLSSPPPSVPSPLSADSQRRKGG